MLRWKQVLRRAGRTAPVDRLPLRTARLRRGNADDDAGALASRQSSGDRVHRPYQRNRGLAALNDRLSALSKTGGSRATVSNRSLPSKQGSVGLTHGCARNAVSVFADTGRAVAHVRGSYVPKSKLGEPQQRLYSITSSAATSKVCGTVRPSAFAVLRLMTKSNLVG